MRKSLFAVALLISLLLVTALPAHASTQFTDSELTYAIVNIADGSRLEFATQDEVDQYLSQFATTHDSCSEHDDCSGHDAVVLRAIPCGVGQHRGPIHHEHTVEVELVQNGIHLYTDYTEYYHCVNCGVIFAYRHYRINVT